MILMFVFLPNNTENTFSIQKQKGRIWHFQRAHSSNLWNELFLEVENKNFHFELQILSLYFVETFFYVQISMLYKYWYIFIYTHCAHVWDLLLNFF